MILHPPFFLIGEAGRGLDETPQLLGGMGVYDPVLKIRSLDADELTFQLVDNGRRPAIPDDDQWITLVDSERQILFTGKTSRTFKFPERIYSYTVRNVYVGLQEAQLVGRNGRPFIAYFSDDLARTLADIVRRSGLNGLPIQAPDQMPPMYVVPKMTFRSTTYASSIDESLKWLPGTATRMDYSTNPPTLRFYNRASSAPKVCHLRDISEISLKPSPTAVAKAINFSYSVRSGDTTSTVVEQLAGDATAAGVARQSAYLSGADRLDAFLAEALVTAIYAREEVNKLIVAGGGTVANNTPVVNYSWPDMLALDTTGGLTGAVAAEPGFVMQPSNGVGYDISRNAFQYPTGSATPDGPYNNGLSIGAPILQLQSAAGTPLNGFYPSKPGWFSDADLAAAGVQKTPGFIRGSLTKLNLTGTFSAGETFLINNALASRRIIYSTTRVFTRFTVNVPVDALSVPPLAAQALIAANNDGFNGSLVTRAGYTDIPLDLAQNYFERQNWIPFSGSATFKPLADFPVPGDCVNLAGLDVPSDWSTMAAMVSESEIDLFTLAVTVSFGYPARLDYLTLSDRLRIPAEDNYQPG